MLRLSDLYTHQEVLPVVAGNTRYGTAIVHYEVRRYADVRNLGLAVGYLVNCTQRLRLPNRTQHGLDPVPSPTGFAGYPALVWNEIKLQTAGASATLVSYSPKTLNASVVTSRNVGTSAGTAFQQEHTSGSATSQTNSYNVSGSLGFFGDAPTGDIGGGYESSTTTETSTSDTTGRSQSRGSELSDSASLSIKDWACFAQVDDQNQTPSWTWSQEYPWNVMQFRSVDDKDNILLPDYVLGRLYQKGDNAPPTIFPPSELSLFGVDQVAKCSWFIIPDPAVTDSDHVTIQHAVIVGEGSHGLDGTTFRVSLAYHDDIPPLTSKVVELGRLGLDPVSDESPLDAAVNFAEDPFQIAPAAGKGFLITSRSNKLRLTGAGFGPGMTTDFSRGTVSVHIDFKVAEDQEDITLFLKHWKTTQAGCMLTIVVNGDKTRTIVKHVDSPEGDGVDRNVTAITLRNRDYLSGDYCDLVGMGLNSVDITVQPATPGGAYQLRAVAVA